MFAKMKFELSNRERDLIYSALSDKQDLLSNFICPETERDFPERHKQAKIVLHEVTCIKLKIRT